jgi:hypothetical protein
LRRYKTPCEITFDTEVPIPKRSKLGTDSATSTFFSLELRNKTSVLGVSHRTKVIIFLNASIIFLSIGCGVHWGVYIKDLAAGLAKESGNVETGDYINTVRSQFYIEGSFHFAFMHLSLFAFYP